MMDRVEIHKSICNSCNELYKNKNNDYGDSFARTRKEVPNAIMIRLYDKIHRLGALLDGAEQKVKDESIDDTLFDLANYALMELTERAHENKPEMIDLPFVEKSKITSAQTKLLLEELKNNMVVWDEHDEEYIRVYKYDDPSIWINFDAKESIELHELYRYKPETVEPTNEESLEVKGVEIDPVKMFDWEAFRSEQLAVHCKTKEEAINFCNLSHDHGIDWVGGESRESRSYWGCYNIQTCYCGELFTKREYYENKRIPIVEWSDYMQKEIEK